MSNHENSFSAPVDARQHDGEFITGVTLPSDREKRIIELFMDGKVSKDEFLDKMSKIRDYRYKTMPFELYEKFAGIVEEQRTERASI